MEPVPALLLTDMVGHDPVLGSIQSPDGGTTSSRLLRPPARKGRVSHRAATEAGRNWEQLLCCTGTGQGCLAGEYRLMLPHSHGELGLGRPVTSTGKES